MTIRRRARLLLAMTSGYWVFPAIALTFVLARDLLEPRLPPLLRELLRLYLKVAERVLLASCELNQVPPA